MKNIGTIVLLSITLISCGLKKPLILEKDEDKIPKQSLGK